MDCTPMIGHKGHKGLGEFDGALYY